jgi:hypothetical protein
MPGVPAKCTGTKPATMAAAIGKVYRYGTNRFR